MSESTTDDPTTADPRPHEQSAPGRQRWLSGFVSLIGLWLAVAPFVYGAAPSMRWNNLLVGGAIFLLAGYNYYRLTTGDETSIGVMALVALLALWIAVSHFTIGTGFATTGLETTDGMLWNNVVSGFIAAALAAYIAYVGGTRVEAGAAAGPQMK